MNKYEIIGIVEQLGSKIKTDLRGDKLSVGDRITWTEYFHHGDSYYREIKDMPQKSKAFTDLINALWGVDSGKVETVVRDKHYNQAPKRFPWLDAWMGTDKCHSHTKQLWEELNRGTQCTV